MNVINYYLSCLVCVSGKHPADLLSVVLSVYMYQNGANIPLPEVDEVLVCNSNTTAEDVNQFFLFCIS